MYQSIKYTYNMFCKIVAVSAVLAVASAGLLPVANYGHGIAAAPIAYNAAPLAYSAPVAYAAPARLSGHAAVSSQNIVRHDQGHRTIAVAAPVAYSAPVAYAAPRLSGHAVSSQNIVSHNQGYGAIGYAAPARVAIAHSAPVVHAAPIVHAAPAHGYIAAHQPEPYDAHPNYEFSYSVADGHTGDNKSQHESRDGDVVHGEYSLVEADGSVRRVEYSADAHSGFNAVVHRSAPSVHAAPVAHAPAHILAHHSSKRARSAALVEVLISSSLTSLQSGSSHCLWENIFFGKSVLGQAVFQAFMGSVLYDASKLTSVDAKIFLVNSSEAWTEDKNAGAFVLSNASVAYSTQNKMFAKSLILTAVLAIASAGLIAEPHYSSAAAVSSQNIVRHDQPRAVVAAAPVAYHASPVAYQAPVAYRSAPVAYQAPVAYRTAPVAYRAPVAYSAPVAHYAAPRIVSAEHEVDAHPQYDFSYSVADGHTGDNKSQHESRDGDVVHGEYSLVEADGSVRRVEYTADDHNGFNAVVSNSAPNTHAAPAPTHVLAHH
ncbi:uncharacterized protein LOC112058172 [Bicyclus anynana]|uniref:Uncharacterized protein LOC112058172 n=1 Tax=Bicyclus anynana TaxID=110368 RepID=A0ABM3LHR7_BICAN|nr:uncharacterized protein LOC112058172 [Bicyclus anynana]